LKIVIFVLLLVFGVATLARIGSTPEARARAADREAIAQCREAQDDPLQELSTRRFMRQGCDQMEAAYRAKWKREP
jgi:hypothetical protein